MESGSDGGHVFMALFLQYREFKGGGGGCSKPPLTFRNVASGFKSFFSFSLEPKKPDFPDVSSDSFKLFWSVLFLSSSYISTTHRVGFIQQVIPKKNGRNKHFSEFSIFNKLQLVPAHFYYYGKKHLCVLTSHANGDFLSVVKRPFRPHHSCSG